MRMHKNEIWKRTHDCDVEQKKPDTEHCLLFDFN